MQHDAGAAVGTRPPGALGHALGSGSAASRSEHARAFQQGRQRRPDRRRRRRLRLQLMTTARSISPSLAALMGAAAALTHASAQAQAAPESDHVGYRYNVYGEDAFDGAAIGSPQRYEVFSQQFQLGTHVPGGALDVSATHEVM